MCGRNTVTLNDTIHALGATAADLLSMAGQLERDSNVPDEFDDPALYDMRQWAAEARFSAGACIAAINHLNGVSPE